jgi:ADP-ribosylglycohydrolase
MRDLDTFAGCLLGGAIGDALGGPVEFDSIASIRAEYGAAGITGFVDLNNDRQAEFTDDTQMTLFTAEGLLCCSKDLHPLQLPAATHPT